MDSLREQIEREVRDSEPGVNMTDYEVSVIVDLVLEQRAQEAEVASKTTVQSPRLGGGRALVERLCDAHENRARKLRAMKGNHAD